MRAGGGHAIACLGVVLASGGRGGGGRLADLTGLPVIERPVRQSRGMLAVLLTGDGGWAKGDRGMADALGRQGVPVVGFISPSYLQVPRTPDGAAEDLRRVLEHYLETWHCGQALVIGYSRGADMVAFMVPRLPGPLQDRITLVTLIGVSDIASFQYRPTDLFAGALRSHDYPVRPELEKLRGRRLLCISGEHEHGSLCPALDPELALVATHAGGHRVTLQAGGTIARLILATAAQSPRADRRIRSANSR